MGKQFVELEKPSKRTRRTAEGSEDESQEGVGYRKLRTRNKKVEYCEKEFVEGIEEPPTQQPKPKIVDTTPGKEKKKRGRKPKNQQLSHQPALQSSAIKPELSTQQQGLNSLGSANNTAPSKDPIDQMGEVAKPQPASHQKPSAKTESKNIEGSINDRYEEPFITSTNVDTGDALLPIQPEAEDVVGQYFAL